VTKLFNPGEAFHAGAAIIICDAAVMPLNDPVEQIIPDHANGENTYYTVTPPVSAVLRNG